MPFFCFLWYTSHLMTPPPPSSSLMSESDLSASELAMPAAEAPPEAEPAAESVEELTLDDQFRSEAARSLGRFRLAMEKLIYSITKALQTSRDLQNLIGVDRNVSWQLFKLLGPVETLATIPYIPASISLRKLLHAAKKR